MDLTRRKVIGIAVAMALVGFIALPVLMCQEVSSGGLKRRTIPPNTYIGQAEISAPAEHIQFLSQMYTELMVFKESRDFRYHGFSDGSPYMQWMKDITDWVQGNPGSPAVSLAEAMITLAEMYSRSYGVDNYETNQIRENLEEHLLLTEEQ